MRSSEKRTPFETLIALHFSAEAREVVHVQNIEPRRDVRALGCDAGVEFIEIGA